MILALLCWSTAWPAACGDSLACVCCWACTLPGEQVGCVCVSSALYLAWFLAESGSARQSCEHILSVAIFFLTCQVALPLGITLALLCLCAGSLEMIKVKIKFKHQWRLACSFRIDYDIVLFLSFSFFIFANSCNVL
jgi:hypothetical protein